MKSSDLATDLLSGCGTRLGHSQAVAEQAGIVAALLDEPWRAALVDAAWLHDIGYAPSVAETGFHPLDGARWLRVHGWSSPVCNLVAWHTRAGTEAMLRGLGGELEVEFFLPPGPVQAALAWADLTSSPTGERCSAEERIAEILSRYAPDSVVHRATRANETELLHDAHLMERLANQQRTVTTVVHR